MLQLSYRILENSKIITYMANKPVPNSPVYLTINNQSCLIRSVQPDDADMIHRHLWTDRSQSQVIQLIQLCREQEQKQRGQGVVLVTPDRQLIGVGQLLRWSQGGEISNLVVHADWRGQGIATALIQYLITRARDLRFAWVEIGVNINNPRALRLYRRLGFMDHRLLSPTGGFPDETVLYLRLPLIPPVHHPHPASG